MEKKKLQSSRVWNWYQNRHIDRLHRSESPEINTYMYTYDF